MNDLPENTQQPADSRDARSADDALPPVEAPSAGFLLQLFFIPLIIVAAIVLVWAMFSWLAHMGSDPRDLVRDLRAMNDASWQRAYTLSELLRNPENDSLRQDESLAMELASILETQLDEASMDTSRLKMRIFLCRALGEFRVPEVSDVLARAAVEEREPRELQVRLTAIEGLAALAGHVDRQTLRDNDSVMNALLKASRERPASGAAEGVRDANDPQAIDQLLALDPGTIEQRRNDLRSAAAFALGVLGGERALDRLAELLRDPYVNVRYNAATGLARHGDPRAVPVLVEMLGPDNQRALQGMENPLAREQKRMEVLTNGIYAASKMANAPSDADLAPLEQALQRLIESDTPRPVRVKASEALQILRQRRG